MRFLKEGLSNKVELEYTDLPITYEYNFHMDPEIGADSERVDIRIDWTYKANKDDVKHFLMQYVPDEIPDDKLDKYLEDNLDDLIDDHYEDLLLYFMEDAIEDAEEKYQGE